MLLLLGRPSLILDRPIIVVFPILGLLGRPDPLSFTHNFPCFHYISFSSHLVRLTLIPQSQNCQKSSLSHKISSKNGSKIKKGKGNCFKFIFSTGKRFKSCSSTL